MIPHSIFRDTVPLNSLGIVDIANLIINFLYVLREYVKSV
jgi:hypothetical protein